jgi:hypothetical protein
VFTTQGYFPKYSKACKFYQDTCSWLSDRSHTLSREVGVRVEDGGAALEAAHRRVANGALYAENKGFRKPGTDSMMFKIFPPKIGAFGS